MTALHSDPIVAIATAPGRGGVGIVRISSAVDVASLALALCGRALPARKACYVPFRDAAGEAIDQGLALCFPTPHSYTGEHVLELQAHGGQVVLQLLLARCLAAAAEPDPATGQPRLERLRIARPGEFTERAFMNDKLDLAQAEAVADLIDASTEAAARSAGRSLAGAFSAEVHTLLDALVRLRMLVEATLDFPEEEIDFLRKADAHGQLSNLQQQLTQIRQRARQGALLREGITVVIAGQPNAGKSSLLNALAGAELAIVTPVPGTTRDKVMQTIQIEGVPVHVIDTAGLRDSDDAVEKIGIARAWDEIGGADAVLFLHDLTRVDDPAHLAADAKLAAAMTDRLSSAHVPVVDVWNKCDVAGATASASASAAPADADADADAKDGAIWLSALTGEGIAALRQRLLRIAGWQSAPESLYLARERHLQALQEVDARLQEATLVLQDGSGALDLLAEELRLAQNALNSITGAFGADDLLGVIFSRFCIGK